MGLRKGKAWTFTRMTIPDLYIYLHVCFFFKKKHSGITSPFLETTPLFCCLQIKSKFQSPLSSSPSSPSAAQRLPELCGFHSLALRVIYMLGFYLLLLVLQFMKRASDCIWSLGLDFFTTWYPHHVSGSPALFQHFCDCKQCRPSWTSLGCTGLRVYMREGFLLESWGRDD